MSPNPNYQRGARFERQLVKAFKDCGAEACRSAGSHGLYDVSACITDMVTAAKVSHLFEWLSTEQPPKDYEWFDWVCRFPVGKLERTCYVKVISDGRGQWAYFCQCKVQQ